MNKLLVIGISGVTCGGKTTLANELNKIFPNSKVISQDDYFLPIDDERHVIIPHLNHINFDVSSSLDMKKMVESIQESIASTENLVETNVKIIEDDLVTKINPSFDVQSSVVQVAKNLHINILIIEGFCIFADKTIEELCNLKYFVTLDREECYNRRIQRVYEPPDCPGYFEDCAWPEYEKHYKYVCKNLKQIRFFNESTKEPLKEVLLDIWQSLQNIYDIL
ncbi:nicotinamide riboside kinase 1 [Onthophagus taurus]|uniref:nicotinamide riboside kinase 1 n=1 Tax=Onthophagus taurus TaxID=166361 RepID=UPI000C20C237|nr:nicotinamide riboside kinase 1 [Onthophagus taurus]XP_022904122.1 nicotinamide riboside kinase 1 [Onthophagus taurus]